MRSPENFEPVQLQPKWKTSPQRLGTAFLDGWNIALKEGLAYQRLMDSTVCPNEYFPPIFKVRVYTQCLRILGFQVHLFWKGHQLFILTARKIMQGNTVTDTTLEKNIGSLFFLLSNSILKKKKKCSRTWYEFLSAVVGQNLDYILWEEWCRDF